MIAVRTVVSRCVLYSKEQPFSPNSFSAEVSTIVCDANKLDSLLQKADQCPNLKLVIKIGDVNDEEKAKAEQLGITLKSFVEVEVGHHLGTTGAYSVPTLPMVFCPSAQQPRKRAFGMKFKHQSSVSSNGT